MMPVGGHSIERVSPNAAIDWLVIDWPAIDWHVIDWPAIDWPAMDWVAIYCHAIDDGNWSAVATANEIVAGVVFAVAAIETVAIATVAAGTEAGAVVEAATVAATAIVTACAHSQPLVPTRDHSRPWAAIRGHLDVMTHAAAKLHLWTVDATAKWYFGLSNAPLVQHSMLAVHLPVVACAKRTTIGNGLVGCWRGTVAASASVAVSLVSLAAVVDALG